MTVSAILNCGNFCSVPVADEEEIYVGERDGAGQRKGEVGARHWPFRPESETVTHKRKEITEAHARHTWAPPFGSRCGR